MLDFSEPSNKKYIPIATFALGVFVGGLLMHFWCQKKAKEGAGAGAQKFEGGGNVIIQAAPAPMAQPAAVVAPAAPAMAGSVGGMNQNIPM